MTVQQVFALALQHDQAGRLTEAEKLYRQILTVQPNHASALHYLGLIAHQTGRHDLAVKLISEAIGWNPVEPALHSNLGEVNRAMGRPNEAIVAYRRALELKPNFPEVHNNLGIALRERGRFEEAVAACRRALEIRPEYPEAYNNLGNALRELGRLEEAVAAYRRALELKPNFPEGYNNLGNALREQGRFEEAAAACHRALDIWPRYPEAHNNLGNVLREQKRLEEAAAAYRRALELKPNFPEGCNNLGIALADLGQLEEAVAAFRRALDIRPDYAEAHDNLGNALRERGQLKEALTAHRRALELRPDFPEAYNNLGIALAALGHPDESVTSFHRALDLKSKYSEALSNLGNALKDQGLLAESITAYRRALHLNPEFLNAHSNLVYSLQFHQLFDERALAEEQARWSRQFAEPLRKNILPHTNESSPDRRLRIGYVSPDFRRHVIGTNLLPLFKHHNHDFFEVICYSGVVSPDKLTEEFHHLADRWRVTLGDSDETLAEMVRQDQVDILVDLAQHMAGNRLSVFARQPAPVQVSFAGYPERTGLETIQYRISDRYLEEGGIANSEGLWAKTSDREQIFLIDSFWCYYPCEPDVQVNELPAKDESVITFGSLNNFCKVNEPLLKLWARVMKTVTNSRLILLSHRGSHRQRTLEFLEREGVAQQRVEFVEPRPRPEYLELYHRLDIVLDTFPYNGHTTSLDALWMGVPVVSLCGERAVSRAGLSQLNNIGLPELVAFTEDQYVEIATQLANDIPRLQELRATLRERMEKSVLMDGPHFARQIEACYRSMWQQRCASQTA